MSTESEKSQGEPVIGEVESFLRGVVEGLEPSKSVYRGPGRSAVLPSMHLWAGRLEGFAPTPVPEPAASP